MFAAFVALLLGVTISRAETPHPAITSVRTEGTNIVVTAHLPPGVQCATLECRAELGSGPWVHRAAERLDGSADTITFLFSPSRQMEVMRVRATLGTNATPRMVVFGDSLSDTGRHFDWYGTPAPPYSNGRYSDGPVWVEYLAAQLGLSPGQWANYAVGGAASGHDNSGARDDAPGMLDELSDYRTDVQCEGVDTNALYVIWIGANDFEIWNKTHAYTNQSPDVLIEGALENVRSAIESLADLGAERFLVANLPDLGQIPRMQGASNESAAAIASVATVGFNENLRWVLGELKAARHLDITCFDTFSLFDAARSNPTAFGFTNVVAPCLPTENGPFCAEPGTYLFWDDRHPTTAGHQLLAKYALAALETGGLPLPTGCDLDPTNPPSVTITTPSGQFTTAASIAVTGTVQALPPGAALSLNGASVTPGADGTFSATVALDPSQLATPIVAEISGAGRVLDRDRITVFQGPSVRLGDSQTDAAIASLNTNGVSALRDAITAWLAESGTINLAPLIPNPLKADLSGTLRYWVNPTLIAYSCYTVDAEPHNGYIRLRFSLHDIQVNYHLKVWLEDIPDPGFECDGGFFAGHFSAYLDVAVRPSSRPGEVVVTPLNPQAGLQFELVNFQHMVFNCDFDDLLAEFGLDVRGMINDMSNDVEQKVRQAIHDKLNPDTEQKLATQLERAIAGISLAKPLSAAVGASVQGAIQNIAMQEGHVDVRFAAAINSTNVPASAQTYAALTSPMQFTSSDPVAGKPYDFAASVSLKTLNQLLLAHSDMLPSVIELSELDLGGMSLPVNAGLLSLLFPALHAEDAATPYSVRFRLTAPLMLTAGSSSPCSGANVELDHVVLEIVHKGAPEKVVLAMVLDLRVCANVGFDQAKGALQLNLSAGTDAIRNPVVTENRICANEAVLARLLDLVTKVLATKIAGVNPEFALPNLSGLKVVMTQSDVRNGYVSLYFNLIPQFGRPDLTVTKIESLAAVDVNFPFNVRVQVKNIGHQAAYVGTWIGASLSLDTNYMNGNDIGIGVRYFNFAGGALHVGESQCFTLENLGPAPGAMEGQQYLLLDVDSPQNLGGAGGFCESSERNNCLAVPIRTTRADAYVASVTPPTGLVGHGPAGAYTVWVGRSDVGIDSMQVPVRVTVGNPVLTWGDALVTVPRGKEVPATVFVPTPDSFGSGCGVVTNTFAVTACANLNFDPNPGNNCKTASVDIAVPYFDLRYEVQGPTNAHVNSTVNWTVTIRNAGNSPSPTVCSRTGIGLHTGENYLDLVDSSLRLFAAPPLAPNQATNFQFAATIPPGALVNQFIKAGVDTFSGCFDYCEVGNQDDQPISICGADLVITDIEMPTNLVGGVGPRTYYVTVRNDGCDPSPAVPLTACLDGNCATISVPALDSNDQRKLPVVILTPPSYGSPGQFNSFPVTACLNNWFDATPANNCLTKQAQVAVPYWDLSFQIVSAPVTGYHCQTASWGVKITNLGNLISANVEFVSGIGLNPNNWNYNLSPINGWSGNIPPGKSVTNMIHNYAIPCGAALTNQFIKAEVNYANPGYDRNNPGNNNYAQQMIRIK